MNTTAGHDREWFEEFYFTCIEETGRSSFSDVLILATKRTATKYCARKRV